jgi:hypothetical protein
MFTFESFLEMIGGIALLIMGRRLYWLFVGLIGFVVGALLSQQFFSAQPEWMSVLVALGFGVAGALLAVFLQGIAIAAAGFIAGVRLDLAARPGRPGRRSIFLDTIHSGGLSA